MSLLGDAAEDDALRRNWQIARDLGLRVSVHSTASPTYRPIPRFARLGLLREGNVYIHCNGFTREDFHRIADTGGAVSIAPAIEMMMGHGYPPVADAMLSGLRPSLSVDVEVMAASDMFGQMRAAFQTARYALRRQDGDDPYRDMHLVSVRDVLSFATLAGAEALGIADRTGSITPGKQADIVLLRTDRPGVAPVYQPAGVVALSMDRADVDTVLVAGRLVKRGGGLLRGDVARLLREADAVHAQMARLGILDLPAD